MNQLTAEQIEEAIKCRNKPEHFLKTYIQVESSQELLRTIKSKRIAFLHESNSKMTATILGFLLHASIFNDYQEIVFLAHKKERAFQLLEQFVHSYKTLPNWLQRKVIVHNKSSFKLENGSNITAYKLSSSAIRGRTLSHTFIEDISLYANKETEEFMNVLLPCITATRTPRLVITGCGNQSEEISLGTTGIHYELT